MAQPSPNLPAAQAESSAQRIKQIQAQLSQMTKVFMDGADPIVIRDLDGNVLDMNQETERVFGWGRSEILGARTRHLLAPEYQQLADEVLRRVRQGETFRNVEAAVRSKSGEMIPVLVTVFLLTDDNQQPTGYAEIIKDISQLKLASEKLQKSNRDLQQFTSVLAHDLGAPIRAMRYFAQSIQSDCGPALDEDAQENLQGIISGADQMDCLVTDLLNYARVGHREVVFKEVDCEQVFAQALTNLSAAVAENQAEIECGPLPTLIANRTLLVQLFQNLIGNAIKFRRFERPKIRISAEPVGDHWRFSIADNGIGIDSEHFERIFEVFRRLHGDNVFPGTGIGLAVCKAIVQRHGGCIWVESEKGHGSTFWFTLARNPPTDIDTAVRA